MHSGEPKDHGIFAQDDSERAPSPPLPVIPAKAGIQLVVD